MPEGYSGQYSLRWNLVSLSYRKLKCLRLYQRQNKKATTLNVHKANPPIPPGGGIPTKL